MDAKKILVVIPDADTGGVTSSAVNFCNTIVKNGYEVHTLVMNGKTLPLKSAAIKHHLHGISQFWKLGIDDVRNAPFYLKPFLLLLAVVKKYTIRKHTWYPKVFKGTEINDEFDAVIAYRQNEPCYYFALNCVNAKKKIAMIHSEYDDRCDYSPWDYLLKEFDSIACVSKACASHFKNHYPEIGHKFSTIYNMFDIDTIKLKSQEPCEYVVDNNFVNIISIARQENGDKQMQRVPHVCKILKERGVDNIHWYLAGDGPDMEGNIALSKELGVSEMLTFCGNLSNPFALLKECDLLILTSRIESFGMVLKEAHTLGKPVIAMRYPSLTEIIDDGVNGLIAEQDVDSLADKITDLLEDKKRKLFALTNNMSRQIVTNDVAIAQFESLL